MHIQVWIENKKCIKKLYSKIANASLRILGIFWCRDKIIKC
jgi:hypothetical protein